MSDNKSPLTGGFHTMRAERPSPDLSESAPSGNTESIGADFQKMFPEGVKAMTDLQKSWFDMAAQVNLGALDCCKRAFWFVPGSNIWFEMTAQTLAAFIQANQSMMQVLVEQGRTAPDFTKTWQQSADEQLRAAGQPFRMAADTLERGMDILFGTQKQLLEIATGTFDKKAAKAA